MPGDLNPASSPGALSWLPKLLRDVANLLVSVRALEQAPKSYMQVGTVTTWISGPTCVVTWDSGGTTICQKPASYTPTPGTDVVVVAFSPMLALPQIMTRIAP